VSDRHGENTPAAELEKRRKKVKGEKKQHFGACSEAKPEGVMCLRQGGK